MNPRLYTIEQVAGMMGLTIEEVVAKYKLVQIGNFWRIREEDLHD